MADKRPLAFTESEVAITFGGAAFPSEMRYGDGSVACWPGMMLLDYFAAASLSGLIDRSQSRPGWAADLARDAYEVADAMVKEGMSRRKPSVSSSEEPKTP